MWKTEQKVHRFVEEHHMIETNDVLVAGISGGADSVCLCYLLLELQKKIGFRWIAVHVNHNLRGAEADRDQEFVEELCKTAQVPVSVVSKDVRRIATEQKMSLEEAGRVARYEAFLQIKEAVGGTKIVLAHHQDDLAETMIHHLARGTGIDGLCSLKPVREDKIRPLLCLTRKEIEQYLEKKQAEWKMDSSNLEDDYTRNKIRHHIIPYLCQEVNAQAVTHMAETAQEMQEIVYLLDSLKQEVMDRWVLESPEETFFRAGMECESILMQRRIYLQQMKRLTGVEQDFGRIHGQVVADLWKRQVGKRICLPEGLVAVREYHGIRLYREKTVVPSEQGENDIVLQISGKTIVENCTIMSSLIHGKINEIIEKKYTKWFDYGKICHSLRVRHRQKGDRIQVHASGSNKKISDYFIDQKIPRDQRDQIWLLADGSDIVWVIGHRISEKYKVSDTTDKILHIQVEGENIHE